MLASSICVAALQLNSQQDVVGNLSACKKLVWSAAERGAEVILLPENFAFFGPDVTRLALAEHLLVEGEQQGGPQPIQKALASWARQLGVALIGGGMPTVSDDPKRPYNTCVVFSKEGDLVAHYHKVHLFDVTLSDGTSLRESASTMAGSASVSCSLDGIQWGLSICYDLRFPELYRQLVDQKARIVTAPAAFTIQTGKDHWEVLLRARAIESQAWVVAAAQVGKHPQGRWCYGHSMIIDPWGTVVARSSDRVGIVVANLDLSYSDEVQERLPCLKHRRL